MKGVRAGIVSHDIVAGNAIGIGCIDAERVVQGCISAAIVKKAMNITRAVVIASHNIVAGNATGIGSIDAERVIQGRVGLRLRRGRHDRAEQGESEGESEDLVFYNHN
jgi:hypothetical protein